MQDTRKDSTSKIYQGHTRQRGLGKVRDRLGKGAVYEPGWGVAPVQGHARGQWNVHSERDCPPLFDDNTPDGRLGREGSAASFEEDCTELRGRHVRQRELDGHVHGLR